MDSDFLKKAEEYSATLLPNIELKINNQLSTLALKPKATVKEAINRYDLIYKTVCVDSKGNTFFFKANLVNKKNRKVKDFLLELLFYKSLLNTESEIKEKFPRYCISRYVKSGYENFYWLLREYTKGEVMGNWFSFDERFLNNTYLDILVDYPDFVQFLQSKLSLSEEFNFSELPRKDYYWLKKEIEGLNPVLTDVLGDTSFKLILKEIEKNKKLLNDTCQYLLHRDNHPKNIIAVNQSRVSLLDWTDVSIGSYVYDFADLWVHAWKNPQWQKAFLEKFIKKLANKNEALLLFKILLFYLLAVEIKNVSNDHLLSFAVKKEEMKKFQEEAISAHSKTLNYACHNFEKIYENSSNL